MCGSDADWREFGEAPSWVGEIGANSWSSFGVPASRLAQDRVASVGQGLVWTRFGLPDVTARLERWSESRESAPPIGGTMDHQALLFGGAARPSQRPGEVHRAAFGLVGAGLGCGDEGLDVNVRSFGLSPISLDLAPTRSRAALPYLEKRGQERGRPRQRRRWSEIGVPDCFISVTQIIQSSHELGVMRQKQTLVR